MSRWFSAARLRARARFLHLTEVSIATFEGMLKQLVVPWDMAQRHKFRSGHPWDVLGLEDYLLIMLIDCRRYVTQVSPGFCYSVNRTAICQAIQRTETFARPLFGVGRKAKINRVESEALIVDRTGQPIQRPGPDTTQKAHYSAKNKRHTVKSDHIVAQKNRIAGASPSCQAATTTRRFTALARGYQNRRAYRPKMSTKATTRSIETRSSHARG
jgi:hypothetical protein